MTTLKNILIAIVVVAVLALGYAYVTTPHTTAVKGTDVVELFPSIFANGLRLSDDKTYLSSTCIEQVGTTTAGLRYYIQFVASSTNASATTVYATTTKPVGCL